MCASRLQYWINHEMNKDAAGTTSFEIENLPLVIERLPSGDVSPIDGNIAKTLKDLCKHGIAHQAFVDRKCTRDSVLTGFDLKYVSRPCNLTV